MVLYEKTAAEIERGRFQGCLLGLAVGDALGTTLEFRSRGSFEPITDMTGGGPFLLTAGQWTDDTSMALCLATSLLEQNGFDAKDQMERYDLWYRQGYMSSTGICFDIGHTVRAALKRFEKTTDPLAGATDAWAAGNGSIMRLAPVPMYYYPNVEEAARLAAKSSVTTHAAPECLDACRLFSRVIVHALAGDGKNDLLQVKATDFTGSAKIAAIGNGDYREKDESAIRGSGYVVESLEAALWCFYHTDSFEAAVLKAANLGDDADTTAAICGQLAGAYYGMSGIPKHWLERLTMCREITELAVSLHEVNGVH